MEYTPLADPFNIDFYREEIVYKANVVYAKSTTSCANLYQVMIIEPEKIPPFFLQEKPVHNEENDSMIWVDEQGRESDFYQLIGQEIADQMKDQLGVFLIDNQPADREENKQY